MEAVRKGKGLTPENEQIMIDNGVPDWYIWSCKRLNTCSRKLMQQLTL